MFKNKVFSNREQDDAWNLDEMWGKMSKLIIGIAREVLGETKRTRIGLCKDKQWWNTEVEKAITEKKTNSRHGKKTRKLEDWEKYQCEKLLAKQLVKLNMKLIMSCADKGR